MHRITGIFAFILFRCVYSDCIENAYINSAEQYNTSYCCNKYM